MVASLRWIPPVTTAFMLQSPVKPVDYRWVPARLQPEPLRLAVVAAEDQKFWTHNGFDLDAIQEAMEHNQRSKRKRGASTISQQVAKNLFLWPGRSWLRKGVEATFTVLIEAWWGKPRILEMYLNTAEFGPGIFGVEAAAQRFFGRPAAKLTPEQCTRLAAVLPNPRKWHAEAPGPYVVARSNWLLGQIGYRAPLPEPVAPPEAMPPREWHPADLPRDAPPQTAPLPQDAPGGDTAAEPEEPELNADDLPPPAEDAPAAEPSPETEKPR
jgi:monofunctional biosynthetic peptidoglycan transglycosylase